MEIKDIKPIPKYILRIIHKKDKEYCKKFNDTKRFYSYLTKYKKELLKITVAARTKNNKYYYKQVAVHILESNKCFVKDMEFFSICGYVVGWYKEGLSRFPKYYEDNEWYESKDKYYDPYAITVNKDYVLKLKKFKYSALNLYPYSDIFKYLRLYLKYPECEMLVKFSLPDLATSKMILSLCHKNNSFRKFLIKNRDTFNNASFDKTIIIKAFRTNTDLVKLQEQENLKKEFIHDGSYKDLKNKIAKNEITKFVKYLQIQKANMPSYSDYLDACEYLHLDLNLEKNKYPHNFRKWHDIRIDQYRTMKNKEDEKARKEFYKKFSVVANKYSNLQNIDKNYVCLIAKSPKDLINEGDKLHHCVGSMNYDQKFVREESLIFFVRNKETPTTPYVTLEYSPKNKKVLQCYGDSDTTPKQEVLNFVKKIWLPYANKKLKAMVA